MLIPDDIKVHLYCGVTDMRKSINTLAIMVQKEEIERLNARYREALEQFKLAQQRRFSRSSESNVPQLPLDLQFDEADSLPVEELPKEENTITVTYIRNDPKRRTLPDNFLAKSLNMIFLMPTSNVPVVF